MAKVMAFGTFDRLHPGHEFFLKKAAEHGELYVVVALDSTVRQIKGVLPSEDQGTRMAKVQSLPYVKRAMLGHPGDKHKVIEEVSPDTICLGYDQVSFTGNLKKWLDERGLRTEIIRIEESVKPHLYKSSRLRGEREQGI